MLFVFAVHLDISVDENGGSVDATTIIDSDV